MANALSAPDVGDGGSGLFAAIEAAEMRRRVLVLEKNLAPGGTTNWAVGSLSSSASPMHAAIGIQDRPAAHFEDMALFHGAFLSRDNPDLRRVLVENVPDTLKKLLDMGVVFFGPMPEPPHRVPRMHNVLQNSRAYAHALYRRARELGVDIRLNHRVFRLLYERERVVGVEAEADGSQHRFIAREMKRKYAGESIAQAGALVKTSTGDAHQLALGVGAGTVTPSAARNLGVPPKVNLMTMLPPSRFLALLMKWSTAKLLQA
ncbi:MAG: FAD-binding protein [Mesorhizobium sp.]|uniref:FAD-binding protein n=1 Tax=unclassified Mesorhizobium TaxID=325217 RepID=UPI000FD88CBE|nr:MULTISPECIES: FAD-binding protein [unclassified Mesorhizobium]RWC99750.1 MAG: FAD-binding protein [Mesorhizobium sp.]RWE22631.1 MAG: FAD-binding protein [Mesorhizobium sp.]TGQ19128.1 FAD-binding protein [Mesorhizobium sp. M00.F.Ca.ET.217.01.1.1]TGV90017.1 FAD-binding protein [Mesorhizobium sp. M00.F.Ca.ET.158.01.1.1]